MGSCLPCHLEYVLQYLADSQYQHLECQILLLWSEFWYCSHCTTSLYLSSCVHLSWSFSISSLYPTAESLQSNNQCGHELLGPGEMLFQMPRWHFSSKAPSKDHWRRMTTWTKPSCCLLMKKLYVWSSPIVTLQERCIIFCAAFSQSTQICRKYEHLQGKV